VLVLPTHVSRERHWNAASVCAVPRSVVAAYRCRRRRHTSSFDSLGALLSPLRGTNYRIAGGMPLRLIARGESAKRTCNPRALIRRVAHPPAMQEHPVPVKTASSAYGVMQ